MSKSALDAIASELEHTRSEIEVLRSRLSAAEREKAEHVILVASLKSQVAALEETRAKDEGTESNNDGWSDNFDAFGTADEERVDKSELDAVRCRDVFVFTLRNSIPYCTVFVLQLVETNLKSKYKFR